MLGSGIGRAAPLCRGAVPAFARSVTISVQRQKLREQTSDGPNAAFAEDNNPEKAEGRVGMALRSEALSQATMLMKRWIKVGGYAEALDVFAACPEPDVYLYNSALAACAKAHWYNRSLEIWRGMPKEIRNEPSYSVMIDLCSRVKMLSQAEGYFAEMQDAQVHPGVITLTSLARAASMANNAARALEIFETAKEFALPNASERGQRIFYQVVMSAFAREGDYAKTRELFMHMTESKTHPDHGHFNSLLTACALGAESDTAEGVLTWMSQCGFEPRIEEYNILISCFRNDLPRCQQLLRALQDRGLQATTTTYAALLEAHILAGDKQGALALADVADPQQRSPKVQKLLDQASGLPD